VDNQVQIAHNVQVGDHCLLVAQSGISGSTKIGDFVTLAGKVGVVGHIEIGARSIVGGNSVVAKSLPEGSFVTGFPARPHREWMEVQAAVNRLPKLMKDLRKQGG
jgi:UDP-3-O-[3-hydroxymyristoyl] glucosamine N-acyltransferase